MSADRRNGGRCRPVDRSSADDRRQPVDSLLRWLAAGGLELLEGVAPQAAGLGCLLDREPSLCTPDAKLSSPNVVSHASGR